MVSETRACKRNGALKRSVDKDIYAVLSSSCSSSSLPVALFPDMSRYALLADIRFNLHASLSFNEELETFISTVLRSCLWGPCFTLRSLTQMS